MPLTPIPVAPTTLAFSTGQAAAVRAAIFCGSAPSSGGSGVRTGRATTITAVSIVEPMSAAGNSVHPVYSMRFRRRVPGNAQPSAEFSPHEIAQYSEITDGCTRRSAYATWYTPITSSLRPASLAYAPSLCFNTAPPPVLQRVSSLNGIGVPSRCHC